VLQIPIKLIKYILWSLYTGRARSPRYGPTLWAQHAYSLSHFHGFDMMWFVFMWCPNETYYCNAMTLG